MPRNLQLFYIASEAVEAEHPCRLETLGIKIRGGK